MATKLSEKRKRRIVEDDDEDEGESSTLKQEKKPSINGKASSTKSSEQKKRKLLVQESESDEEQNKRRKNGKEEEETNGHVDLLPANMGNLISGGVRLGSIVRVKLHNFVTYDDCEFRPGPHLNVVVGPNGTGKSTIVCGLALGLAGATSILGRAKEIGDFVKNGRDKGYVEIDIMNRNGKVTTVRRDIKRDNKSDWKLDGKPTNKKAIQDLVKKMNIQVDNLCQFLPQDKVCNFAALSFQDLLKETEKAVGSEAMLQLHNQLIDLRKQEKELDLQTREHGKHLEDLKQAQKSVERDVLRFQERQRWLKKIEDLEKKKPWLEFENQRLVAFEAKNEYEEATKALKAYEEEKRKPLLEKIHALEEKTKQLEIEKTKHLNLSRELDRERRKLNETIEKLDTDAEGLNNELTNLQNRANDRKRSAASLKKEIEGHKLELENLPDPADLTDKANELNETLVKKTKALEQLHQKVLEVQENIRQSKSQVQRSQQRMKQFEDVKTQKINVIRQQGVQGEHALKAQQWVQANASKFEKKVYGPLVLEINVKDPLHAKYLENTVHAFFLAFVCSTKADMETFNREIYDNQRLQVQSVCVTETRDYRHPIPVEQLKKYGITSYLSDVFDAPEIVKVALNNNFALHTVACGTAETEKHIADIVDKTNIGMFFTPTHIHKKTKSNYGKRGISTSVVPLKQTKFLSGVDMSMKGEIELEIRTAQDHISGLENELRDFFGREKALQQEQSKIKAEKEELNSVKKKKDAVKGKISFKENQLRELEMEEDTAAEQQRIELKLKNFTLKKSKIAIMMRDVFQKLVNEAMKNDLAHLQKAEASAQLQELRDQNNQTDHEFNQLKRDSESKQRKFSEEKEKARKLKEQAESKAPLTEETKALLETLPNTLEQLEEEIMTARTKADVNYTYNASIIEQYEKRKKELEDLESKVNSEQNQLNKQKETIERIKNQWLPTLQDLVNKINENFSQFFNSIGCEGKVQLDKGANEMDFENYAIKIFVKFRASDELQPLDAHTQSGGERSVATMLYLISLQELTPCPFRLVDEINQGMDPINERMIFKVVADCACKEGVPQYFLITPKLLSDLPLRDKMNILFIYNGPFQSSQEEWDQKRILA